MIRICTSLQHANYDVLLVGRRLLPLKSLPSTAYAQKRLPCFFRSGKLFYLEYNLRLFFFLLVAKVDVIYSVDLDTLLPGFLVSRLRRKICVYDAHEYFTETPEVVRRPRIKRIWSALANFTIPKLRYCITVGSSLANLLQQQYGVPFVTIRNVPFRLTTDKDQKAKSEHRTIRNILLYQGALNEGRGLEELLEAMQYISNAELWLAGEGDLSQQLRQLATTLGVEKKVNFLGYVLPAELKTLTAQATIGFNLLHNAGLSYYYSLANKAFDYVQAGIPSIHSNFPEYRQLNIEHEVFVLLDNLHPQTIAAAVERLLTDATYYARLATNCQAAANEWIWEKEEQRLLALFDTIRRENALVVE